MSDDQSRFIVTEAWLESRLLESYFAQQAATYESVASLLKKRAGECYVNGSDRLASYLRDVLVKEMEQLAKDLRKKQHEQEAETGKLPEPTDVDG